MPSPAAFGAEVYQDATTGRRVPRPRLGRKGEHFVWKWHLPFVDPEGVTAVTDREDIVLTVARSRRVVPLPSVLRRCNLLAVSARDGGVHLTFVPDPDVWPAAKE
jgi:arsenite-transporting ATPase